MAVLYRYDDHNKDGPINRRCVPWIRKQKRGTLLVWMWHLSLRPREIYYCSRNEHHKSKKLFQTIKKKQSGNS